MNFGVSNIIWGTEGKSIVKEDLIGLPPDVVSVKIKQRAKREAHAIVKFKDRVEDWILEKVDSTHVRLCVKKGSNSL
jgi:hypothetical protein